MPPDTTAQAAATFDRYVREELHRFTKAVEHDDSWLFATLPSSLSGTGLTSAVETRHSAHYASWASSWPNIVKMFPAAITVTTAELATSQLPFAIGIRSAHAHVKAATDTITTNQHKHELPRGVPRDPTIPAPSDFGTHLPCNITLHSVTSRPWSTQHDGSRDSIDAHSPTVHVSAHKLSRVQWPSSPPNRLSTSRCILWTSSMRYSSHAAPLPHTSQVVGTGVYAVPTWTHMEITSCPATSSCSSAPLATT
jgi:hypothetical protein